MNRRQKIIVSVVGIFIVLLALVGLTYAYFLTRITGNKNDKSISISTANLALVYDDGDNTVLTGINIVPGTTISEKTFSVTNTGNVTVDSYGIFFEDYLVSYVNDATLEDGTTVTAGQLTEFERPQDFVLTVTCVSKKVSDNSVSGTCSGYEGEMPSGNDLVVSNPIDAGIRHEYTLSVYYENANTDQSADMNKKVEAKLELYSMGETVDIEGQTADTNIDYVQVNSTPKKSYVNDDGTFKVIGLESGSHTIQAFDSSGNELTPSGGIAFTINTGTSVSISSDKLTATVTPESRNVKINLTSSTVEITGVSNISLGAFAKKILANGATYVSEWEIVSTSHTWDEFYSSEEECINNCGYCVWEALNNYSALNTTNDKNVKVLNSGTSSEVGLFKIDDDFGTSYFFRGPIVNNYVKFAGDTWRIIRINGDGSIRIMCETCDLSGLFNETATQFYVAFNSSGGNGWYNDTNITSSTTDSLAKQAVDNFYESRLTGYKSYLADSAFCQGEARLSYTTLKCSNPALNFTSETNNINGVKTSAILKYPIGLVTADEVYLSGVSTVATLPNEMVKKSYMPNYSFFTMTPVNEFSVEATYGEIYGVNWNESLLLNLRLKPRDSYANDFYDEGVYNPVINIKSNISVSGDGTEDDPYKIG